MYSYLLTIRFKEKYLPVHMRLNFLLRLFRFSFFPLTILVLLMIFNSDFSLADLHLCNNRKVCLNYCETAKFPDAACTFNYSLTYKGNHYPRVYEYQTPAVTPITDPDFLTCRNFVADNPTIATSSIDSSRSKRVHTCFYGCSFTDDGVTFSNTDPRSACPTANNAVDVSAINSLYCVDYTDSCEDSALKGKTCAGDFCFSAGVIALTIFLADIVQLAFEVSLYYSRSIV